MQTDAKLLQLSPHDNVLVARAAIGAGETLHLSEGAIVTSCAIPLGFKVAARVLSPGEKIIKYGASIGSATQEVAAGEIVHTHNMQSDYLPTYEREQERFVDEH